MEPWSHGAAGPVGTWGHGAMGPWGRRAVGPWGRRAVGPWVDGDVGTWGHGDVGTWGRGALGPWGRGAVGTWQPGDVGTCGGGAIGICRRESVGAWAPENVGTWRRGVVVPQRVTRGATWRRKSAPGHFGPGPRPPDQPSLPVGGSSRWGDGGRRGAAEGGSRQNQLGRGNALESSAPARANTGDTDLRATGLQAAGTAVRQQDETPVLSDPSALTTDDPQET